MKTTSIVILLATIGFCSCKKDKGEESPSLSLNSQASKSVDKEDVYVVGEVINASNRLAIHVEVRVDLFGDNGVKVGTATDFAETIAPGATWNFRALAPVHFLNFGVPAINGYFV